MVAAACLSAATLRCDRPAWDAGPALGGAPAGLHLAAAANQCCVDRTRLYRLDVIQVIKYMCLCIKLQMASSLIAMITLEVVLAYPFTKLEDAW